MKTAASPHSSVFAIVPFFLFAALAPIARAQAPGPPTLLSISALSSGQTPEVVFSFDSDVSVYHASTAVWTEIRGGAPIAPVAKAVITNPATPKVISVPLDFSALSGDDAVQISLTLSDGTHPPQNLTPAYYLDLSFLKAIQGYKDQISSLTTNSGTLTGQLSQCSSDLASARAKVNPAEFDYVETKFTAPTKVILHFRTDAYTTIRVTELNTGNNFEQSGIKDIYVTVSPLSPSTNHHFSAVYLDATTGKPVPGQAKNFSVQTPAAVPFGPAFKSLTASGPTTLVATVDFNPSGTLPADFKGYIVLYYRQRAGSGQAFSQPVSIGDGKLDENGIPSGTAYSGVHDFPITVPSANSTYDVTFTAYDQYGDAITYPEPGFEQATPAAPKPLAFDGPIAISMNTNTGLTVQWSANKPISTAQMSVDIAGTEIIPPIKKDAPSTNGPPSTSGASSTNGASSSNGASSASEMSVSTDLNGLQSLLDKAQSSKAAPIIKLSMSDSSGETASISMTVTFTISSTGSSKPASSVQTAANNVTTAAQKGRKIDWSTVLQTGLGMLVKLI